MYGSILGDIAGSRFEFSKPENFDAWRVPLFSKNCFYTDDTVMTIATKYAILNSVKYASAYVMFGKKYPLAGYGTMFKTWIDSHPPQAYNSYGNGAAMRVSFIGRYFTTIEKVREEARKSAMCTHNHPEGVKGAESTASAVFLATSGCSKREIKHYIEKNFGYSLSKPLRFSRPFAKFEISSQKTMPIALRCFLESNSWEDCIRRVFSITCDTDTVACIAGGIADAYYHGTNMDEYALLEKYLAKPNLKGERDTFLLDWAVK